MIQPVAFGEAPSCVIIYCDNLFSECHADIDVQIYNEPSITESNKTIALRSYTFDVLGFGFDLDRNNNQVLCGYVTETEERIEFDCVLKQVVSSRELRIESKLAFGRQRLGKVQVKVGVALRTWTEWTTVGIVREKYSLQFIQITMAIIFISTLVITVCSVQYILNKRRLWLLYEKTTLYGKAITELENENKNSIKFPGYFSGINENWKPERAAKPTGSDDLRRDIEQKSIQKEIANRNIGLVVQNLL